MLLLNWLKRLRQRSSSVPPKKRDRRLRLMRLEERKLLDVTLAIIGADTIGEDVGSDVVYRFTRTAGETSVDFSVGGTATFTTDFTETSAVGISASSGSINFGGNTEVDMTVRPVADALIEGNESIELTITQIDSVPVTRTAVVGTIDDADTATLSLAAATTVNEDDGTQNIVVTLNTFNSGAAGGATLATGVTLTADVTDAGGGSATSGTDYTALTTQQVTFTAGDGDNTTSVAQAQITPTNDALIEGNETVNVSLGNISTLNGQASLGTTSGVHTIDDNDTATLSIAAATTVNEDDGAQNIVVTLNTFNSGAAGGATLATGVTLTADVTDAGGGSATSGTDYNALGTLPVAFASGAVDNATFNVPLTINDDIADDDAETINVALGNISSLNGQASLGTASGVVTITDNDATGGTAAFATMTGAGNTVIRNNGGMLEIEVGGVVQTTVSVGDVVQLNLTGAGDGSTVLLDVASGALPATINVDGRAMDTLTIVGNSSTTTVAYDGTGDFQDGTVSIDGITVNFDNVPDNTLNITGTDALTLDFAGGDTAIAFTRIDATNTQVAGNSFTTTSFANPATSLTVNLTDTNAYTVNFTDFADNFNPANGIDVNGNAGGGNIDLTVDQLGGLTGALDVDLMGGTDSVVFQNTSQSLAAVAVTAETITATSVALTVSGVTTLDAGASGKITLNNAGNDFQGNVTLANANTASLRDTNALSLASVTTTGSFSANAGGPLTDSLGATISVGGSASLTGASIVLGDNAGDTTDFGSLTFTSASGAVAVAEDSSTTVSGVSTAGADLTLTSTDSVTLDATVSVTGDTTITAGTTTGTIDVNAKVTGSGTILLDAADAITIDAAIDPTTVTLQADDDITISAAVAATNLITVSAGLDGSGSVVIAGSGSLTADNAGNTADVTINTGATSGDITLTGTINADDTVTIASAGNITGTGLVTTPTVSLNAVTQIGGGASLELAATSISATTTNGTIDLDNTNASDATFTSLVAGTGSVIVDNSGGGNATFTTVTTGGGAVDLQNTGGDLTIETSATASGTFARLRTSAAGNVILTGTTTTVGDTVTIISTGTITGSGLITADQASLTALDQIGDISDLLAGTGTPIQLTLTGQLTNATITQAAGEINLTFNGAFAAANGAIVVDADGDASVLVEATGDIDAAPLNAFVLSGNDSLGLSAGGTLTVPNGGINVGAGDLRLAGDTDVVDSNNNLGPFTADQFAYSSGGSTSTTLNTTVNEITATMTGMAGLTINETDAVTLVNVSTANGAISVTAGSAITATNVASTTDSDSNDISITASNGNIIAGVITAGTTNGDVSLTATTGSIIDDTEDSTADVTGDNLVLTAAAGIGQTDGSGGGSLDTTADTLNASVTGSGLINIDESNAITLTDIDTANGSITIDAGGAVTATDVVSSTDADGNGIVITAAAGNITVGVINAGTNAGDVTLTATTGSIVDSTNDSVSDISGDGVVLTAQNGIGETDGSGNGSLDTIVGVLTASVTSAGLINIDEADAIFLENVATANGPITVDAGGAVGATVVTSATDNDANDIAIAAATGNLTIGAVNAGATAGDVTLTATTGTILDDATSPDIVAENTTLSATIAPGLSPGILDVDSNLTFADGATFSVDIDGTTPGNSTGNHDQIDVMGTVTIGANVSLMLPTPATFTPMAGDVFVIINNDGFDVVSGTFDGLMEGATFGNFLGSGRTARLTYQGGTGNDVAIRVDDPTGAVVLPANGNSNVTVQIESGSLVVRDGGTIVDSRPFAGLTGTYTITGEAGANDTLTIDLSGGDVLPSGGLIFKAGEGAGDNDTLIVTGYSLNVTDGVADVTVNHTGAESGSIDFTGLGTIQFAEIEPLTLSGTAADLVINLPAGADNTVLLRNDGAANDPDATDDAGVSSIDGMFEFTEFNNPTNSLTVNFSDNNNTLTIDSLDSAFDADITINGGAGTDTVRIATALDTGTGESFTMQSSVETVDVNASVNSDAGITFSGATTTTLAANLQTDGGAVTVSAGSIVIDAGSVLIDTESGDDGDAGDVNLTGVTGISADAASRDLMINAASGSGSGTGGTVTLTTFDSAGGSNIDDLSVTTDSNTDGAISITGSAAAGNSIVLTNAVTVDIDGNVTAATSLTIQNVSSEIDIADGVTLTATAGTVDLNNSVTLIDLSSSAGGTNTIVAGTNVELTAVSDSNAAGPGEFNVQAGTNITLDAIALDGSNNGVLDLGLDTGTDSDATLTAAGALSAGTIEINAQGTNDDVLLQSTVQSSSAGISIDTVDNVDIDGNVTAATSLTIQNVNTEIDVADGLTLTATAGAVDLNNSVTLIDLSSSAGGTNTIVAGTNVELTAVSDSNAAGPGELNVQAGTNITLVAITLDGSNNGVLDLDLDTGTDSDATLTAAGALSAGTIEINAQGTNDDVLLQSTVQSSSAGISIDTVDNVDIDGNVTAATSLTIQNVNTEIDIADGLTLTATAGAVDLNNSVTLIDLSSSAGGTNTIVAGTNVELTAVSDSNAAGPGELNVQAGTNITLAAITLDGSNNGVLDLDLDTGTDSDATLTAAGALSARTIEINAQGTNDDVLLQSTLQANNAAISIDTVDNVDIDGNVTAATSLTIQNVNTEIDIADGLTLTATAGAVDLNNSVTLIDLSSSAGGTNTIVAGTNVELTAVSDSNAAGPGELNVQAGTNITLAAITLDGSNNGVLDLDLDTGTDSDATLTAAGALSAGTIEINAQGTNDDVLLQSTLQASSAGISIDTVDNVDIDGNVTAATSLTIQNVNTEIDIADGLTLTATAGAVDLNNSVTLIDLSSSAGGTNTIVAGTNVELTAVSDSNAAGPGELNVQAGTNITLAAITLDGSGNVLITASGTVTSLVGANITTTNAAAGNPSGTVDINAGAVELSGNIVTTGAGASSNGGNVDIDTSNGSITVANIAVSAGTGATAGNVTLNADGLDADVNLTASVTTNEAGTVTITADDRVAFSSSASILASGSGAVSITANTADTDGNSNDEIRMDDGSLIDAGSGTITLSTDTPVASTNGGDISLGRLLTSSTSAMAVSITSNADVVDLDNTGDSDIDAVNGTVTINAVGSVGGSGTDVFKTAFNAIEINAANLTATAGGAIALNPSVSGSIALTAPTQFLTFDGNTVVSDDSFTVTNLALVVNGSLTIADISGAEDLQVAGDLRIEATDVVAADGSIDLSAQRLLFKSGASEILNVSPRNAGANTLSAVAAAGQNQIAVNSAAGFAVDDVVLVRDDDSVAEIQTVTDVNTTTNVLTFSGNLASEFAPTNNASVAVVVDLDAETTGDLTIASSSGINANDLDCDNFALHTETNGRIHLQAATGTVIASGAVVAEGLGGTLLQANAADGDVLLNADVFSADVTTTLTSTATAGAMTIDVANAAGFDGQRIRIDEFGSDPEFFTVTSVAGNTLTLSGGLVGTFDAANNAVIQRIGAGNITIVAGDDVDQNSNLTTDGAGTVFVLASNGTMDRAGVEVDGINVNGPIATATGDVLLRAATATGNVRTTSSITTAGGAAGEGDVGLQAGDDVLIGANITTATGDVIALAENGTNEGDAVTGTVDGVIMSAGTQIVTTSGDVLLRASGGGDVRVGLVSAAGSTVSLAAADDILDSNADEAVNVLATNLRAIADSDADGNNAATDTDNNNDGSIGLADATNGTADTNVNALDLNVTTVAAESAQGIYLQEVTVGGALEVNNVAALTVTVDVTRESFGSTPSAEQAGDTLSNLDDLTTTSSTANGNVAAGPVKVVVLAGSLTVSDGSDSDGVGVATTQSGDILLEARGASSDVIVNADVQALTSATSGLSTTANASDTTLDVISATGFQAGQRIVLDDSDSAAEQFLITDVTGTTLTLNAAVTDTFTAGDASVTVVSHITLQSDDDIDQNADIATTGPGSVLLLASNMTTDGTPDDGINMQTGVSITSGGGNIRLTADTEADVRLGLLNAGTGDVSIVAEGDILDNNGGGTLNVQADALRLVADAVVNANGTQDTAAAGNGNGRIGDRDAANALPAVNANAIDTQVSVLAAQSADGIYVQEADAVVIRDTGAVSISRVEFNSTLTSMTDVSVADLVTTDNGSIKLVSLAGTVTVTDGAAGAIHGDNGIGVRADSTGDPNVIPSRGSILLEARGAGSDIIVNANVKTWDGTSPATPASDADPGRGHITIVAGDDVFLNANVLTDGTQSTTAAEGSVLVVAQGGSSDNMVTVGGSMRADGLIMASGTSITTSAGVIRLAADNESDVVLGLLDTGSPGSGAVSIVAERDILDGNGGDTLNVQTQTLRMWADAFVNTDLTQDVNAATHLGNNQDGTIGNADSANGTPAVNANAIDTQVSVLAAQSADGIYVQEADAVVIRDTGAVSISRVEFNSTLTSMTDVSVADLVTTDNGSIKLVSLAGTITVTDGAAGAIHGDDGIGVRADSTGDPNVIPSRGSILLEARGAGSDIIVNANVKTWDGTSPATPASDADPGRGHITIVAGDDVFLNANILTDGTQSTTAAEGSVLVVAQGGSSDNMVTVGGSMRADGLIMASGTSITTSAGVIRLAADNESDVVLGLLDTGSPGSGAVSIVAERDILDGNGGDTLNVQTQTLRMWADAFVNTDLTQDVNAATHLGNNQDGTIGNADSANGTPAVNANAIDTQVSVLAAQSADGIYVQEADAVVIRDTGAVSISRVEFNSTLTTVTDVSVADLVTTDNGSIKLVTVAGTITVTDGAAGAIHGDDGIGVRADSTGDPNVIPSRGSILLEARGAGSDIIVNANVKTWDGTSPATPASDADPGRGHITIVAGDDVFLNANVSSGGVGTVFVLSSNLTADAISGIDMQSGVSITSGGGNIRLTADTEGDVRLGLLNAGSGDVSVIAEGDILDNNGGGTLNVQADALRLVADAVVNADGTQNTGTTGNDGMIGAAAPGGATVNSDAIDTQVTTLAARSADGVFLLEVDDLRIDATGEIVVQQVNFNSTVAPVTDLSLDGVETTDNGDLELVSMTGSIVTANNGLNGAVEIDAGGGRITVTTQGDFTVGRLVTTNATATAVQITSRTGAVRDGGDADEEPDIEAPFGGVVIDAVTGVGTGDAIETQIASLDVDNVDQSGEPATGNIEINEVDDLSIIHVDNDAGTTLTNDSDNGVVSVTLQNGGNLIIVNNGVAGLANAAVQSESVVRLSANDITINDDVIALEAGSTSEDAQDGTGISERVEIRARGDFQLMDNLTISTDDNVTTGESVALPLAVIDQTDLPEETIRLIVDGDVRLGDDVTLRTDHGVTRQIAPRPQLFVVTPSAFLQVASSPQMRGSLDGSLFGRMVITVGVEGEENLRVDVDWGDQPVTPLGLVAGEPDEMNRFGAEDDDKSTFIIPAGNSEVSLPHQYELGAILRSIRNGRDGNPLIVGVRFSVTQNQSIVIAGKTVTTADGLTEETVSAFPDPDNFGDSDPGTLESRFDAFDLPDNVQLALLSSTDTDGLTFGPGDTVNGVEAVQMIDVVEEFTNIEAPTTGDAEFEFVSGGAPPQDLLLDAVVFEAAVADPDARPSLVIFVEPLIPESVGAATASSATQSQDFLEIRWNNGQKSDLLTIEQGERLLSSPERLESYITGNSATIRQNTSYEIWTVTRIPQKGITIEQRVFEFQMSGGRLGPGTEILPEVGEAIEALELVPIGLDGMELPHPAADGEQEPGPADPDGDSDADAPVSDADTPNDQGQANVDKVIDPDTRKGAGVAGATQPEKESKDGTDDFEEAVHSDPGQEQSVRMSDYNRSGDSPAGVVALGITLGTLARRRRRGSDSSEQDFSRAARLLRRVRRSSEQ